MSKTMHVVVADQHVDQPTPANWVESVTLPLDGVETRFGLAVHPRTAFDSEADYNRDHVLVRISAFSAGPAIRWSNSLAHDSALGPHRGFGVDFVGEVVEVGAAVTDLSPGRRVIPCPDWPKLKGAPGARGFATMNASREFLRLPANALVTLDQPIADDAAATFSTAASIGFAMARLTDPPGDKPVLVFGGDHAVTEAVLAALESRDRQPILQGSDQAAAVALAETRLIGAKLGGFAAIIDVAGTAASVQYGTALLAFSGRYVTCIPPADGELGQVSGVLERVILRNSSVTGVHLGSRADLEAALRWADRSGWTPAAEQSYTFGELKQYVSAQFESPSPSGPPIFRFGQAGDCSPSVVTR